jgi:hypothetical protein
VNASHRTIDSLFASLLTRLGRKLDGEPSFSNSKPAILDGEKLIGCSRPSKFLGQCPHPTCPNIALGLRGTDPFRTDCLFVLLDTAVAKDDHAFGELGNVGFMGHHDNGQPAVV